MHTVTDFGMPQTLFKILISNDDHLSGFRAIISMGSEACTWWRGAAALTPLRGTGHWEQVLYTEGLWVPLVVIDGVHILPGIPRLFQQMLTAAEGTLPTGPAMHRRELGSNLGEGDIADPLRSIATDFPEVPPSTRPI